MRNLSVALFSLAWLASGQSQPPTPRPAKSSQVEQRHTEGEQSKQDVPNSSVSVSINNTRDAGNQSEKPSPANGLVTLFTGILAAAAIIQVLVYFKQTGVMANALEQTTKSVLAMEESNRINLESLRAVQRAYVNFDMATTGGVAVRTADDDIESWKLRVGMTNTGNTPAYDIRTCITCVWPDSPLPDDYDFQAWNPKGIWGPFQLAAKAEVGAPVILVPHDVIKRLFGSAATFYLYGWARYRDVFADTHDHTTEFCFEVKVLQFHPDLILETSGYHRHNSQT